MFFSLSLLFLLNMTDLKGIDLSIETTVSLSLSLNEVRVRQVKAMFLKFLQ